MSDERDTTPAPPPPAALSGDPRRSVCIPPPPRLRRDVELIDTAASLGEASSTHKYLDLKGVPSFNTVTGQKLTLVARVQWFEARLKEL